MTVGTAWQDANGNTGVGDDDMVAIDTSNPSVVDVVANDPADRRRSMPLRCLHVAVTFSQAVDQSATPTLIFAPA